MEASDLDSLCKRLRGMETINGLREAAADAIEALREQVADLKAEHRDYGVARDAHDKQMARAERAEAENAALRKDAERYRWLRVRNEGSEINPPGPYTVAYDADELCSYPEATELDAAIDAALLAGKEGK